MDLPPIRERILADFGVALGNVPGALDVSRLMLAAQIQGNRPSIAYWSAREGKIPDSHFGMLCELEVLVLVMARSQGDWMFESSVWLADVERAVMEDPTRGHLALKTEPRFSEIYAGEIAEPDYTIEITYLVTYPHKPGNPYMKPGEE
jgi:hypothetical protein